jgi:hypothetical protein
MPALASNAATIAFVLPSVDTSLCSSAVKEGT